MFLNKEFNGSYFEEIPEEHIGWCVLAAALPLTVLGLCESAAWLTIPSMLFTLLGAALVAAAWAYRSGFRAGCEYRPLLIGRNGIGPP